MKNECLWVVDIEFKILMRKGKSLLKQTTPSKFAKPHSLIHRRSSFLAFYTLDFVTYMFETPFTEISLPSIRNGTYVMYGTYIEPTLLHFCLVACYSVTLSKTVNSLVEKPLLSVVYFGRRPHESGEKKWGFKNVKIRVDMAFRPR